MAREADGLPDRVWVASYVASDYACTLARGVRFRSIHNSKQEAEGMQRDPQAIRFTVCEYAKLPAPVQPEDETTLPALDAKCACGGSIEAIRSVHSYDECVNMDCYAPRIQMEAVLQALEAERDALKAENEELKAADSMKNTFWGQYKVQRERADSLQSQLDAVVGQETAEQAWERGYRAGADHVAADLGADLLALLVVPYTPPLKAGQ